MAKWRIQRNTLVKKFM